MYTRSISNLNAFFSDSNARLKYLMKSTLPNRWNQEPNFSPISNSGGADLIGLLLAIIQFLYSCLQEQITINHQLKTENIELMIKLHKLQRVFPLKMNALMKALQIRKNQKQTRENEGGKKVKNQDQGISPTSFQSKG